MFRVDLAVYDRNRQLVLTVETKRLGGVTDQWARQLRRNLIVHGYPKAQYFLLATPHRFFLWVGENNGIELTAADYTVEPDETLRSIYSEYSTTPDEASSFIFEQVVSRWLRSFMYSTSDESPNLPKWVDESGLGAAIRQGDFQFEIAA